MSGFGEETDGSSVIHARCENQQHVVQQKRLVVKIELNSFVVELNIGHFSNNILEVSFSPGFRWMRHHRQNGVIILLVFVV